MTCPIILNEEIAKAIEERCVNCTHNFFIHDGFGCAEIHSDHYGHLLTHLHPACEHYSERREKHAEALS